MKLFRTFILMVSLGALVACSKNKPPEVPSTDLMMQWISEIEAKGYRMPGYAAAEWVVEWSQQQFEAMGLVDVELDPIEVRYWRPLSWSLEIWHAANPEQVEEIASWPVPLSAAVEGLEGELILTSQPEKSKNKIAVVNLPLIGSAQDRIRDDVATWAYDPENEFDALYQTWPMSRRFQRTMDPEIEAGAIGFIGILDFPWETDRYRVPYDGKLRSIPGLYLSRSNGEKLKTFMAKGNTRARIKLKRETDKKISHNVIAVLPGVSDDWVMIGSHHDGPWNSAVEDASGVALVLAQAKYWAGVPKQQRPHNLIFQLNGGHMSGGAGLHHAVDTRMGFVKDKLVTAIWLEHAAREAKPLDGKLVPTDRPEVRWWFSSFIPELEEIVARAICKQKLERSLIMPVEGFPGKSRKHPPTDGSYYHPHAPLISFLTAPMYLFDPVDRMPMVHEASLVPVTEAVIGMINDLGKTSAEEIRKGVYAPPRKTSMPGCDALLEAES